MVKPAQKVLCPECGAEIKSFPNGSDLALPVAVNRTENSPRNIFTVGVACPFCTEGSIIPEWARSLRPEQRETRRWRFTYRGIL